MKVESSRSRTTLIVVPAALAIAVAAMGGVAWWRASGGIVVPLPRTSPVSAPATEQVSQKRLELIRELLRVLEVAASGSDRPKVAELSEGLVREGDATVTPAVEQFQKSRIWNYRIALLDVLSRIRTGSCLAALESCYATLHASETALKVELVRRIGRMGGGLTRECLARLLANEADETLREEMAKGLIALGVTPEEASTLQKRDRDILETQARLKDEQRSRIAALEKVDPRSDQGLADLKKAATEETVIAITLLAYRKLQERNDAVAAGILADRVKAPAETNDSRILQTNALASLAQMKVAEARLVVRDVALGDDDSLRLQAVELLGGYGDRAMVPLLEQAALKDKSERMAKAAEKARVSIETRSRAVDGQKR